MSWEEYSSDEDAQTLAERHLHIILECILDIAAFIAARTGVARGPTYREVVRSLVESGVIPAEFRQIALSAPGMRNILVHGYAEIRHDLIYRVLRTELDSLAQLLELLRSEAESLDP